MARRTCKRRGCTTKFTPPANRPGALFCGPACKEADRRSRARATPPKTGSDLRKDTPQSVRVSLGTHRTGVSHPQGSASAPRGRSKAKLSEAQRAELAELRAEARYELRRFLRNVTTSKQFRYCGRGVVDPATGVISALTVKETHATLGRTLCANPWLCPVCAATTGNKKAEQTQELLARHIAAGGQALFVTLTVRHWDMHELDSLFVAMLGNGKVSQGAFQKVFGGRAWQGDPKRGTSGLRHDLGFVGVVRAIEVTYGANGWHPHLHLALMIGGTLAPRVKGEKREVTDYFDVSPDVIEDFRKHAVAVWTRHLVKHSEDFRPGENVGVDIKAVTSEKDAEEVGRYVAKVQDDDSTWLPGNELARFDLKQAAKGSMTPMDIGHRWAGLCAKKPTEDLPGFGGIELLESLWKEYEGSTYARRRIYITPHLFDIYDVRGGNTEADDQDDANSVDVVSEYRAGLQYSAKGWGSLNALGLDYEDRLSMLRVGPEKTRKEMIDSGVEGVGDVLTPGQIEELNEKRTEHVMERLEKYHDRVSTRLAEGGMSPVAVRKIEMRAQAFASRRKINDARNGVIEVDGMRVNEATGEIIE